MENQDPSPERGRVCAHCGEPISPTKRKDSKFCSGTCRDAENRVRNKDRRAEQYQDWCVENREARRGHIRAAKIKWRLSDIRRSMLTAAKSRAKAQHLPFNLTLEDLGPLPEYCPVLGIPLEIGSGIHCDGSPSLDKIIPKLGYVRGNVLIVSMRANRLKSDATVAELRQMAEFYETFINQSWMKGAANG
jgi:hypothetical protein